MGILRGVKEDAIKPLVDAIISSGLKTVEITMNTDNADKLIRKMVEYSKSELTIGAGTVLTSDDFKKAFNSGATFIVSPTLVLEVADLAKKNNLAFFPGALTPQEIYNAHKAAATMVKVFPSKFFGPGYFKEIKGPFSDIELLACGGVNKNNIKSFFENGASAVAFGASIFKKELIEEEKFDQIASSIKELITAL